MRAAQGPALLRGLPALCCWVSLWSCLWRLSRVRSPSRYQRSAVFTPTPKIPVKSCLGDEHSVVRSKALTENTDGHDRWQGQHWLGCPVATPGCLVPAAFPRPHGAHTGRIQTPRLACTGNSPDRPRCTSLQGPLLWQPFSPGPMQVQHHTPVMATASCHWEPHQAGVTTWPQGNTAWGPTSRWGQLTPQGLPTWVGGLDPSPSKSLFPS